MKSVNFQNILADEEMDHYMKGTLDTTWRCFFARGRIRRTYSATRGNGRIVC